MLRCRGELDALAGREIPSLKLNGQLVVLSACGGSAGKSLSGMGSDSIASGFLMGGASAVIASHWPVEDKSTAQLMEAFYQELGNGRVDHALRAAQLRLASNVPNSPRLWAAFEVIGDGDLVVPIQASLRVRGTTFSRRHWLVLLLTVSTGRDRRCGTAQAQRGARRQIRLTPTKPWEYVFPSPDIDSRSVLRSKPCPEMATNSFWGNGGSMNAFNSENIISSLVCSL